MRRQEAERLLELSDEDETEYGRLVRKLIGEAILSGAEGRPFRLENDEE